MGQRGKRLVNIHIVRTRFLQCFFLPQLNNIHILMGATAWALVPVIKQYNRQHLPWQ